MYDFYFMQDGKGRIEQSFKMSHSLTLSMHYRSVRNTRVGDKAKSDNIIANTYRLDWILDTTKLILLLIVVAVSYQ